MLEVGHCLQGASRAESTTRFWWERPEGLTLKNVFEKPVTVHSRKELVNLCKKEGIGLPHVAGYN